MKRTVPELPGYVTVSGASDRLRLAPRTVRGLIYAGRIPSWRLGRLHYIRVRDVDLERRRRLGLPLPAPRRAPRRTQAPRPIATRSPIALVHADGRRVTRHDSGIRRQRAEERAAQLERWLRSGHHLERPALPFEVEAPLSAPSACEVCRRPVRAGGRLVRADAADGRNAARLCVTCARRALLAWSDERRRESVAGRQLTADLGGIAAEESRERSVLRAVPAPSQAQAAA